MRYLALVAGLLLAPALTAGQLPVAAVDFSPAAMDKLQQQYGENEAATLQSAILAAVSQEAARVDIPAGLTVTVTVRDIAPTHPTRKQSADNPALDVIETKYIGGADLAGEVRDANQRILTTVTYRYFAPTLKLGSISLDPWADARLSIDRFAVKVAAACRRLHKT